MQALNTKINFENMFSKELIFANITTRGPQNSAVIEI